MIELDAIDRQLLGALARDATQSAGALGRRLGLSQPATWRRIKRLQDAGVIKGRRLRLNAEALGFGVRVFLGLKLARKGQLNLGDFERAVSAIPEVLEVFAVTGPGDLHLRVAARSNEHLHQVLERVLELPGIRRTETKLALNTALRRSVADLVVSDTAGGAAR